ncbi:MAG: hypothetical protein ACFCVD_07135 [Nodosilinea sp.]
MASKHRQDHRDDSTFIQWPAPTRRRPGHRPPDPEFVVDGRRLYRYLDSLESLSGE